MGIRIVRKLAKIFASNAGGTGVAEFGSTAGGSTVFTTDPAVIQSTEFETGLAAGVIAGTKRLPVYEEINGVYYVATRQLAYLFQEGVPEYDSATEYFINSIVKKPSTYELYGSAINNNIGNALPSAVSNANWTYLGNLSSLGSATPQEQDFRLSLTSGNPVDTGDVVGATTIYCTPYLGNRIALYNGSSWRNLISSEFSLPLGTLISGKPYDVFCYDNAGTPTLEFLAWTDDTTRSTGLVHQDGVLVKSGSPTRRYLGTFYTTSTTTTESSVANRYLINYYNRIGLLMQRTETDANWTYTSPTVRQANGNPLNQLNFISLGEEPIIARLNALASNTNTNVQLLAGMGIDSTTIFDGSNFSDQRTVFANSNLGLISNFYNIPSAGKHSITWLESSAATGITTWIGGSSNSTVLSGVVRG